VGSSGCLNACSIGSVPHLVLCYTPRKEPRDAAIDSKRMSNSIQLKEEAVGRVCVLPNQDTDMRIGILSVLVCDVRCICSRFSRAGADPKRLVALQP
jgi:hypothetical protein